MITPQTATNIAKDLCAPMFTSAEKEINRVLKEHGPKVAAFYVMGLQDGSNYAFDIIKNADKKVAELLNQELQ